MNPKLEILALSDYVDFSKSGKFTIAGIFDEIYVEKFPSSFVRSFIAFTLSGYSPNNNQKIGVKITGPKEQSLVDQIVEIKSGSNGKANFFVELLGMPLPNEGQYKISILSNNKLLGFTNFRVIDIGKDDRANNRSSAN